MNYLIWKYTSVSVFDKKRLILDAHMFYVLQNKYVHFLICVGSFFIKRDDTFRSLPKLSMAQF